jgi:hypothetical protein
VAGSYAAEQQALKDALKTALEGDAGGDDGGFAGGVLRKGRARRGGAEAEADADGAGGAGGSRVGALLDEYFGPEDEQLSEADRFLKRYLATQAWRGDGGGGGGGGGSDDGDDGGLLRGGGEGELGGEYEDLDQEEQFLEEADRFEAAYNFRWGAGAVAAHRAGAQLGGLSALLGEQGAPLAPAQG